MASINEDRDSPFAGYEPTRPSRLRTPGEPPPLPPPTNEDGDGFGVADEDGLRMLAALQTLTSLEPDYSDDLAAEASVSIIDSAGDDLVAEVLRADPNQPLRALLNGNDGGPALLLNGYETFTGTGEEATVEIVEPLHTFDTAEPSSKPLAAQPSSLAERIAAVAGRGSQGSRFYKALSGG